MSTPNQSGFSFFNINQGAIPVQSTYGRTQHSDDHIKHKELIKKFPDNTSPVGPGSVVRFHIANAGKMLDPKSILWFFTLKLPTQGVTKLLQGSAHSIIQSVEIRLNNTDLIERVENYNILRGNLHNFLTPALHHETKNTIVERLDGSDVGRASNVRRTKFETLADSSGYNDSKVTQNTSLSYDDLAYLNKKDAADSDLKVKGLDDEVEDSHWALKGSESSAKLALRFDLVGFLNQNKFIPMDAIRSLDIEITLASNTKVRAPFLFDANDDKTSSDFTAAAQYGDPYVISDQYLTMDMYDFSIPFRAALSEAMQESGLYFEIDTYVDYAPALSQGQTEIILRRDFSSLKGIYIVVQTTDSFLPTETDNSDISRVEEYQIFIDNRPISAQPIKVGSAVDNAEQIYETLKSLRLHGDLQYLPGCHSTTDSIGTTRALRKYGLLGVDLEKSDLISGRTCQEIRIYMKNTNENATAHVYFHYDKKILALPGFQFSQMG
jgi:hypothetical protein